MSAGFGPFARIAERAQLRRWGRAAQEAEHLGLAELDQLRARARALKGRLERLLQVADSRLALPRVGDATVPRPLHADWVWRPPLWAAPVFPAGQSALETGAELGGAATLFHDCQRTELSFRQVRNIGPDDLAPYSARLDVFRFDGSFLSLVVALPDDGVRGLGADHLVRLTVRVDLERPLEIFARLNVRHGPNTEQMVREFPMDGPEMTVEFDLAYSELKGNRVDRAWIDLIFEGAEMNQITLRDLTMARRPRAQL